MAYRLGVDVGEPNSVTAICIVAGVQPSQIDVFLHGTTVATNAVPDGKGARVELLVTEGYRQIPQIARSLVSGGLAGWIIWPRHTHIAKA